MKHLLTLILFAPFFASSQYSTVRLEEKPINILSLRNNAVIQFNESLPNYHTLSDEGKEFLYWTNFARKNPKEFWDSICEPVINTFPQLKSGPYAASLQHDLYKAKSLPFLRLNDTLIQTAQEHADDIGLKKGKFSHSSTDGKSFQERFKRAGLNYYGAENISLGAGNVLLSLIMLYLDHGLEYPGHRITLLNKNYTDIGIGVQQYGNTSSLFLVQHFASPQ